VSRFTAAVLASLALLASGAPPAHAQLGRGSPRRGVLAPTSVPVYPVYYAAYGYGAGYYGDLGNPYGGYLAGAADVTLANAYYQKTIQEARLLREEARRSALETRRKYLEQAQWERDEWLKRYDPEVVRQQDQERALHRARHDAPLVDIVSGRALNTLFTHVARQQGRGERGPRIALSEDVLKGINLAGQDTRANPGLLKYDGRLQWPLPLQGSEFDGSRDRISMLIAEAVNQARNTQPVDAGKLVDLRDELGRMKHALDNNVSGKSGSPDRLSPSQYIEANRYLDLVKAAIKTLESPDASSYFNEDRVRRGTNVAELVKYMSERGLTFAAAVPGDADCYVALYRALQAFDAGMNVSAARSVTANAPAEPR
jgi:hypothetical protein